MDRAKRITPKTPPARSGPAQPASGKGLDMAELWRSIAAQIALWRGRRELSQKTLAQLAGRSPSWLSKVERGERKCDSLEALCNLAAALGVSPAALVSFDAPASAAPVPQGGEGARRGPSVAVAGWAKGVKASLDAVNGNLRRLERRVAQIAETVASQKSELPADPLDGGGTVAGETTAIAWLVVAVEGRPVLVPMRLPRRKLLAAGGATLLGELAGSLDPNELTRIAAAIIEPTRTDLPVVGHLEALLAHYRRLDDVLGPRRLLVPVRATGDLIDHLRKDASPPAHKALLSLSAQYQQAAGWLYEDSGDYVMAERAYSEAIERATEGGDLAFASYALGRKSQLALRQGRAKKAVELAQAARQGEHRLTPAVQACAANWEARAWTLKGDRSECRRKLDESGGLLAASVEQGRAEEPPWIYWFVEEQLAATRGECFTDLGDAGRAIEVLERVIPALPAEQVRDRANFQAGLAIAHARDNDPEQAGVVGCKAARVAKRTGSTRVLDKLRGLYAELSAFKGVQSVEDLGDLLRSAASADVVGEERQ